MKDFPILQEGWRRHRVPRRPSIPWDLIAPHEKQAQRNHWQSLAELARRGGLAPCEVVAVLEDRRWREMTEEAAAARLTELVEAYERRNFHGSWDANGSPA